MSTRPRALLVAALLAALGVVGAALPGAPLGLRAVAALWLSVLLPGWLLATALLGRADSAFAHLQQALYGLGAGYGVCFVVMLGLAALPGGVARWMIWVGLAGISLLLALWVGGLPPAVPAPERSPGRGFWLALGGVLLLGGLLRCAHLGYSEFQGDEARVLLRAGEVLQGYPNALYIHQKTPGEILLTAAILGQAGGISEAWARLPFALAGIAVLPAALLLGRRWAGGLWGGAVAALLLAIDGYLIAFARIVQYQSVVILVSLLLLLLLDSSRSDQRRLVARLTLAGLLAAAGLLAHYDLLAAALPALYLLVELTRAVRGGVRRLLPALAPGALLAVALPALFVVPYVRYPGFGEAYRYVVDERLGLRFPYNNLGDFAQRTLLYSSTYAIALLAVATLLFLGVCYRRRWGWGAALAAVAVVGGGVALGLARPAWLMVGGHDLALLCTLPLLGVVLLRTLTVGERTAWLWFGPLFVATLFLIGKPDSHVYIFFLPWALLAGIAVQRAADAWLSRPARRWVVGAAGAGLVLFLAWYPWLIFADAPAERLRTWGESQPRAFWNPFAQPPERAIMGFPLRNGWKVAGALYAQGALTGGFETNARPEVADWYTRAAAPCPANAQHFFLAQTVEPTDDARLAQVQQQAEQDYHLTGLATVGGDDRLRIYTQGAGGDATRHPVEQYAAAFDALTQQPLPPRRGRILAFPDAPGADANFGGMVRLHAAQISPLPVAPGGVLTVRLYWESLRPTIYPYTVFLHVVDPTTNAKVGQADQLPVCGQAETWQWNPWDKIDDPHTLAIAADALPGRYRLYVGLYRVETGERLPVVDASGAPAGDFVDLGEVFVE